jgi:hypothetical protein
MGDKLVSARVKVRFAMPPIVSRSSILLALSPSRLVKSYRRFGISWQCTRWCSLLKAGRSRVRFLMVLLEFFFDLNPCGRNMAWDRPSLWQKWVPEIFPGGLKRQTRRADAVTTFMCRLSHTPGVLWASSRPVKGLRHQLTLGLDSNHSKTFHSFHFLQVNYEIAS